MRLLAAAMALALTLALAACAAAPGPAAPVLALAPYVAPGSAWSPAEIDAYLRSARAPLHRCGVRLAVRPARPVAAPAPFDLRGVARDAQPPAGALPVIFVESLSETQGEPVGGLAASRPPGPAVAVARTGPSGAVYAPERTLAHEIGHAFGLDHVPVRRAAGLPAYNVMNPVSCELCGFAEAQCAHLRAEIAAFG